jgi:hypothetical protein
MTMAEREAVRRWTLLVIAGAGSAVLTMMGPSEARAVARACCFPTGNCQVLSRSVCEDQQGGVSQAIGTTCETVTCPLLCSAAGPECAGECPAGTTCVNPANGQLRQGAVTSAASLCQCVPEIPQGGACDAQPDACAPGLVCENGICAVPAAAAPLLSTAGLATAVASLIGVATLAFMRRRRHG